MAWRQQYVERNEQIYADRHNGHKWLVNKYGLSTNRIRQILQHKERMIRVQAIRDARKEG